MAADKHKAHAEPQPFFYSCLPRKYLWQSRPEISGITNIETILQC